MNIPRNDNEALPGRGIENVRARIAQHCDWFGMQAPKVRTRAGEVILTDELHSWFLTSGASIDWIVLGTVKTLAANYRLSWTAKVEFEDAMEGYDETEREMLVAAMRVISSKRMTPENALSAFHEAVAEKRGVEADAKPAEKADAVVA